MNRINSLLSLMMVLQVGGNAISADSIDRQNANDTQAYVLVHGGNMSTETWNKLSVRNPVYTKSGFMGSEIWDGTASFLKAHNYSVFTPALKDEHICSLTGHVEQICALIVENDLRDIILVGHSYGGMVITGVAAKMPERIRRLVYVDAALPDPGQSLFDIIVACGLNPASVAGLEASAAYVEKIQFDPRKVQSLPKTYIRCTKSEFSAVTSVAKQKIAADGSGWTYIEIPSSHVPMADLPDDFNQLMLDAAKK